VATDAGGYLRRSLVVNAGKLLRKLFLIAISNVDNVGENNDAWKKRTLSAMVGASTTELRELIGVLRLMFHSRVVGLRLPSRIVWWL